MTSPIGSRGLDQYREEMRIELSRNVDHLNKLLRSMTEPVDENDLPAVRYTSDPTDPLRCCVVDPSGNVIRTLSNEAVLRKIKTLESKKRLRQFHNSDPDMRTSSDCQRSSASGSLAAQVREVNSATVILINKLKHQIRALNVSTYFVHHSCATHSSNLVSMNART